MMKNVFYVCIVLMVFTTAVSAQVIMNEFGVTPGENEYVELYNSSGSSVDISGWKIGGLASDATATINASSSIAGGGYFVVDELTSTGFGDDCINNGVGTLVLLNSSDVEQDRVAYGEAGGCPAAQYDHSAERAPNGTDTGDDADDWNYQESPTKGASNTAPAANLGSGTVFFNEVWTSPPTSGDSFIELYNSSSSAVDISGWKIIAGAVYTVPASTSIAGHGFWVLNSEDYPSFFGYNNTELYWDENIYLFNSSGVRLDQMQVDDGSYDESLGCYPDGNRTIFDNYSRSEPNNFARMTPSNGSANNAIPGPAVESAEFGAPDVILVVFDTDMDETTANTASNYSVFNLIPITPQSASLQSDKKSVALTMSSDLFSGTSYTVTVTGVKSEIMQLEVDSGNNTAVCSYSLPSCGYQ